MEIETAKRRHTLLALVIASAAFGAHAAAPELVHAKDYGFNASNSTAAIQAAIDSGAKVVVIDAMPTPWYIDQIKLRSDFTLRFEKGAKLFADARNWEKNKKTALIPVKGVDNVVIEGSGTGPDDALIGSFETYEERAKYCHVNEELQDGIGLATARNTVIRNLRVANCGRDGVYLGGWDRDGASVNTLVENVDLNENHRQGCSVVNCIGATFRHVTFRNTRGTEPTAGLDIEPSYDAQPLEDILVEDCTFGNNDGGGLVMPMCSIYPIRVTVRRCHFKPERGRCAIDVMARGPTYAKGKGRPDVQILVEDCTIEGYGNAPAIDFLYAPLFSCTFRNLKIRQVPGRSPWMYKRLCSPVEIVFNREHNGAFPSERCGLMKFENVTVDGYDGPFVRFVDELGLQDYIGCMSGTAMYNGKPVDLSQFSYKGPDIGEPLLRRIDTDYLVPLPKRKFVPSDGNCEPTPKSAWYHRPPSYTYYFFAQPGSRAQFDVVYPTMTFIDDFAKRLANARLVLDSPQGAIDLGPLHPGTNSFTYAGRPGWCSFRPPEQDGNGNRVLVIGRRNARFAYQGDTLATGEMKFVLKDETKDYVGYFEVPPNVDCRIRVSSGDIELRNAEGEIVDRADPEKYSGRYTFRFRAAGATPETWSFRARPGEGVRVMRFYLPLTGIWADDPADLPRVVPKEGKPAFASSSVVPERYLDLMETAVAAYDDAHLATYVEVNEKTGVTEHGFPRLAANLGVLVANGRATGRRETFKKMMDICCRDATRKMTRGGNEFSVKELVMALKELEAAGTFPKSVTDEWAKGLRAVVAEESYSRGRSGVGRDKADNWFVFACASEQARLAAGLGGSADFVERYVADQLRWFDANGMYMDPDQPAVYDMVTRLQFAKVLHDGYNGPSKEKLEAMLDASAEPTLKMLSACGEIPFGGRSNQFLHNHTFYAALCEWYACRAAKKGDLVLAGRFRRAAARAIDGLDFWLGADKISHVKNFCDPRSGKGCENYAYFDKYMVTMGSWAMLAREFVREFPKDAVLPAPGPEQPFRFKTTDAFHWEFLSAGEYSAQVDFDANLRYDCDGIGRFQRRGAPPTICLASPCCETPNYRPVRRAKKDLAIAPLPGTKWKYDLTEKGLAITVRGRGELGVTLPAFTFDGRDRVKVFCDGRMLSVVYKGWVCKYLVKRGKIEEDPIECGNRNGAYRRFVAKGKAGMTVSVAIEPCR